ncbi:hypothetical protein [Pseudalkalibacillus sp. JSM 102089]|uniref:hypothetical protein n=1 Tax=Pseudalkalibacillus sp. JSM 102089 TaxID=3229856 RepID=UPI003525D526
MKKVNQTFVEFLRSIGYEAEELICEFAGLYYVINGVSYSSKDLHQSEFGPLRRYYTYKVEV